MNQEQVESANRALQLAQTIARDAVNRIAEEFADTAHQNAAAISVFGFLTGVGDMVLTNDTNSKTPALFMSSRLLGAQVGASNIDLTKIGN